MVAKTIIGGILVAGFVLGSILAIIALTLLQPLDALAAPTQVIVEEFGAVAAVFLVYVSVMQPAEDALEKSSSPFYRALRAKVKVPGPIRVLALAALIGGTFGFAFWATADVLGGYNGYSNSFFRHPILLLIYNDTVSLMPYLSSRDKGTQASFYFGIAVLGLVTLRLGRGFGTALRDAITLFAAPCLVVFEIGLLGGAPDDMTWHVTDYLWMGGLADGGVRPLDSGGPYLFSNWLVLCVALVLVASRIPWLSLPSRIVWRRYRAAL